MTIGAHGVIATARADALVFSAHHTSHDAITLAREEVPRDKKINFAM
jgi:hypothetical protein